MLGADNCKWININLYTQWIAAFGGFSLMLQTGILIGWLSPNIVRLTAEDSEIPLTNDQVSWLISISVLSGFLGGLCGWICVELIGTRYTAVIASILYSLGWICLIVADSVAWIFLAKCISGIAVSMVYSCFAIYLGDVSAHKIRGTLISIATTGSPIGVVISTIAEVYLPMKISSSMYLIHSLSTIILFFWLKRSPYELTKKKNYELAKASIYFYNSDADMEKKFKHIKNFVESDEFVTIKDKLRVFAIPTVRKSFILINILFTLPHLSGVENLMSYMEKILIDGKFDLIGPEKFVIYTNIISAVVKITSMNLIDVLGRRILLIISSIGTTIGMAVLGLYFYLLSRNFDAEGLQWLPITSIMLYMTLYTVGFASVPSTVLSELFPESAKNLAAFTSIMWLSLVAFGITKVYQPMVDNIGEAYVFWMHSVLSFLVIPFALCLLPETKGKTFQEIQDDLHKQ